MAHPGGLSTLAVLVVALVPSGSGSWDAEAATAAFIRFEGATPTGNAGVSVAGAGDVNGDGRADVLVGEHFAGNRGRARAGSAYVLFGKDAPGSVDLAALGQAGLRIDGAATGDLAGRFPAPAT